MGNKKIIFAFTIALAIIVWLLLWFVVRGWGYAFSALAIYCIFVLFFLKSANLQAVFVSIFFCAILFAGFEFYFIGQNPHAKHLYERKYVNSSGKHFVIENSVTGFSSLPSEKTVASRLMDGQKVYEAVYTTDSYGRRVTFPAKGKPDTAIIFFGCSFTFGVGVNDEETIPWRVGEYTNGRYAVYNYGGYGYGPHQMLALLENGLSPDIASYKNIIVFYILLDVHTQRSAGLAEWDRKGPRYLIKDGKLVRAGTFAENINIINDSWAGPLEYWETLRRVELGIQRYFNPAGRSDADYQNLLTEIVASSAKKVAQTYQSAQFATLIWPGAEHYIEPLQKKGLKTVSIASFMPEDFFVTPQNYEILNDGHPNPKSTSIVAQGIVNYLENTKKHDNN